jgi:hypothetical protein
MSLTVPCDIASFRFGSRTAEPNADNNSNSINSNSSNSNITVLGVGEVAMPAVPAAQNLPEFQAAVLTTSSRHPRVLHRLQLHPALEAIVYPLQLM